MATYGRQPVKPVKRFEPLKPSLPSPQGERPPANLKIDRARPWQIALNPNRYQNVVEDFVKRNR